MTDDFTWQSTGPVQDWEEYLAYVDRHYKNVGFQVEVAEELVVSRDGEVYVVEDSGVVTANNLELTGVTTHRLVEVDGEWLIQESRWVESNGQA